MCRALALLLILCMFGVCSCSDSAGPVLWLRISAELEIPHEIEEIVVFVTASRSAQGDFCSPSQRTFPLRSSGDLPILIALEQGQQFQQWSSFLVLGRKQGDTVISAEGRAVWPSEGEANVDIVLSRSCFEEVVCDLPNQCLDGQCVSIPSPSPFSEVTDFEDPCEN